MEIIRLGPKDERLASEALRLFGDTADLDASDFLSRPEAALLVAVGEGDLLGWVYGHELIHPSGQRTMLLYALDVVETARRRSVGTDLARAFVEHAEDRRCTEVWVLTEGDNDAAIATYRSAAGTREPEESVMFVWQLGAEPPDARADSPR